MLIGRSAIGKVTRAPAAFEEQVAGDHLTSFLLKKHEYLEVAETDSDGRVVIAGCS